MQRGVQGAKQTAQDRHPAILSHHGAMVVPIRDTIGVLIRWVSKPRVERPASQVGLNGGEQRLLAMQIIQHPRSKDPLGFKKFRVWGSRA